jgi:hypothetical protein
MEEDASFGSTKLNKLLFFSDFLFYRFNGVAITGAAYQKQDFGPVARRLLPEQQRLQNENRAVIQVRKRGNFQQHRLIALDEPNLKLCTGEEMALVNAVINGLRGHGALRLSDFSHRVSVGWQSAELGEDIPYGTVFLAPPMEPTPSQEKRALELAAEHAA